MSNRQHSSELNKHKRFVDSLTDHARERQARHWEGSFGEFLEQVFRADPAGLARTSHQYLWDMIRWAGIESSPEGPNVTRYRLFAEDLFGIDESLERFANYFKAASEGSEVGRRLLLLWGRPRAASPAW